MTTPRHNANGHRRRQVVRRVLAEEHTCALCDQPVDKTLTTIPGEHSPRCTSPTCTGCIPHPMRPEVDEDLPRSRGGSPYDRRNTRLMHRKCNQWKGALTLQEARTKLHTPTTQPTPAVQASPIW